MSETGGGAPSTAYSQPNLAMAKTDLHELMGEMREQNFDSIRFATYRTACKLRFVQKKVNCELYK